MASGISPMRRSCGAHGTSLPKSERGRYQTEEKFRGIRNKRKRR